MKSKYCFTIPEQNNSPSNQQQIYNVKNNFKYQFLP